MPNYVSTGGDWKLQVPTPALKPEPKVEPEVKPEVKEEIKLEKKTKGLFAKKAPAKNKYNKSKTK